MSSFGEALVSAFNGTFGTVTRGRLAAEQAAMLRSEREASDTHRRETREAQVRRGLLNPDGSPRDPGQNMDRAQLQAPAPQPAAPVPGLGAPTSPGVQGAAPAPTAPVQGAPPVAATGVPQGAPAQAAPTPAPAPSPAQPALPEHAQGGSPQGAVAQGAQAAMGGQGAPEGQAQRFEPGVQQEVIQEASAAVSRRGDRPSEAMIVAGHTIPTPPRGPGGQGSQAQAAQYAPELLREVVQHRGEGQQGPLTREDWDGYLRDVTLSAQRNLSPQQQVQALAVVDRIRQAGLQRFAGLAVAAAQAGDMEGAARALNGAASFNPDGYRTQFTATQNGVQMTRQREGGQGEPTRVTVPGAEVVRYATAMLDPTWSLNHYLNVARHEETVRHNRTTEGIAAANLAERRAERGERAAERRANAENDSAVFEARRAVTRAQEDYDNVSRAEGNEPGALAAARLRLERAQDQYDAVQSRGGSRAQNQAQSLDERVASRRAAAEAREGRGPLSAETRREITAAAGEIVGDTASARWVRGNLMEAARRNPDMLPSEVGAALQRFRAHVDEEVAAGGERAARAQRALAGGQFRDEATNRVIQFSAPPRARSTPGGGSAEPPAPANRGSGGGGSVQEARPNITPPRAGNIPIATDQEAPIERGTRPDRATQNTERRRAFETARDEALRRHGADSIARLPTAARRTLLNGHAGGYNAEERRALTR